MDEYTGPIGLYAYLAHRSKVAPIMLRRNLSYRREVYEAERRRINAEVNGKTPICIAKSDKVEPCQDSGKERAAERATDSDIGDRADAKRDAPEDQMHSTGGAGSAGARRAPDGDQQCSRRSMQSVKKNAVVFRLRYQQGQQESAHRLPDIRCPWCDMTCPEHDSLMLHLQSSHDRFSYALDKSLSIPEIYINVKASSATETVPRSLLPHTDFCFFSERRGGGKQAATHARLISCEDEAQDKQEDAANKKCKKINDSAGSMSSKGKQAASAASIQPKAFGKGKSGKGKKGARVAGEKKTLAQRHLFRSQTCLPIDVNDDVDMDYDSDDDVDDEWQLAQEIRRLAYTEAERLMDEFEDVTVKEKAFMKLWNRFVHRHAILADFQVAVACQTFARHYGEQLWQEGLRDELLFHMFALWDFNLLDQSQIMASIALVDKYGQAQQEGKEAHSADTTSDATPIPSDSTPMSSAPGAADGTGSDARGESKRELVQGGGNVG